MSSEPTPFDPTASQYRESCPPGIVPVDASALPAYQRALLVADGTVTRLLEAWALEPVRVSRLSQGEGEIGSPLERRWLELEGQPATAIHRSVVLTGRSSGQFFLYANSLILPQGLPPALRRELGESAGGLGQIIVAGGLESRREGLWFGRERLAERPAEVAALWNGEFLTRCYRLLAGGRPVMLITERFPWGQVPRTLSGVRT